jgi:hypothetical protein
MDKINKSITKREFTTMSLLSSFLALLGSDAQAWEAERKRLQPENFDKIKIGTSEHSAIQILGKPRHTITYALKPAETYYNWHWRNARGEAMIFSAIFNTSKVVIRTEMWRDPQDPSNQSG